MTYIVRDARAWAQRFAMDKKELWAVVEGAYRDTPFYDGLLNSLLDRANYTIILAEQISVDGIVAGGKDHVLAVAELLQGDDVLRQENSETRTSVVFFVDKDDDDAHLERRHPPHVIETEFSDVEAEIVCRADKVRAISASYSLFPDPSWVSEVSTAEHRLAHEWKDWIELRLAAAICQSRGARFAGLPPTHSLKYGELDSDRIARLASKIADTNAGWIEARHRARQLIESRAKANELPRLLKGKWLPGYLDHLVRSSTGRALPRVSPDHLMSTLLLTIDFSADWAEYFRDRISRLIADQPELT